MVSEPLWPSGFSVTIAIAIHHSGLSLSHSVYIVSLLLKAESPSLFHLQKPQLQQYSSSHKTFENSSDQLKTAIAAITISHCSFLRPTYYILNFVSNLVRDLFIFLKLQHTSYTFMWREELQLQDNDITPPNQTGHLFRYS